jgi:hypothetical protein
VVIIVLSADDIFECFRGRVSGKQLFKNVMTLAAGLSGGAAGGVAGAKVGGLAGMKIGLIFGPAGSAIGLSIGSVAGGVAGAFAGGTAAGKAGHNVMSKFIEDDAVEMVNIINERIVPLAQSYLLSKEELNLVIDDLKIELEKEKLLQMFVSKDRNKFADDMLTEIIEKVVSWRARIMLPNAEEFIKGIGRVLELSNNKDALQAHLAKTEINAVEMGGKLLGKKISKHAASKALYVTKQMNMTLMQQEMCLRNMEANEQNYAARKKETDAEISAYKKELDVMLAGV